MDCNPHNVGVNSKTIGCFPLYPPTELLHSMGFSPVVLWGFAADSAGMAGADRHVQPYVCSVGRRLAQFVLGGGDGTLAGIFHYNACDTLRNLPEILQRGAGGAHMLPAVSMHLPAVDAGRPSWERALRASIDRLVRDLECALNVRFSEERFRQSVALYSDLRDFIRYMALKARDGAVPFGEYAALALDASRMPPEEAMKGLKSAVARPRIESPSPRGAPVIISGIIPPSGNALSLMEELGLRIVADDIASLSRSHAFMPRYEPGSGPGAYYADFYRGHAPCPTLLHSADARPGYLVRLAEESGAAGVVFIGEKFCEYEYFEYPFMQKELAKKGIPSLVLEFEHDGGELSASHVTRIQAFAEMLSVKNG